MPPKLKKEGPKTQSTMSKFFAPVSTSETKKRCWKETGVDDFQVQEESSTKKKSKANVESVKEDTGSSGTKLDEVSEKRESGKIGATPTVINKLSTFEHQNDGEDSTSSRKMFQSRDCTMIKFTSSGDVPEVLEVEENEENGEESVMEPDGSNAKSSLYRFQKPGKSPKVKYTPLEQQVVEIKTQWPDTLLCVECGYKYRFFGEDAEIAAKVLNIYCHPDHNFMTASIPVHRLFVHLRRLVAAGHKVGVVKQTETAQLKAAGDNKSAPFARKLDALYTKSTLIGQDVEDSFSKADDAESTAAGSTHKRNHYLMCVYEQPNESPSKSRHVGVVCVDSATGDIIYDEFTDGPTCHQLETRISHLSPVEILLSTSASVVMRTIIEDIAALSTVEDDKIRLETLTAKKFLYSEAIATLTEFYGSDKDSLGKVLNLPKPVVSCLAALRGHLEDFHLDSILKFTSSFHRFSDKSRYMHLSSRCLRNLEVFRNSCDGSEKGSLFWMLDHTLTKFGSRLLKRWLTQPLLNVQDIQQRLDTIEELVEGGDVKMKSLIDLMPKLPDVDRGLCNIFHQRSSPLEFHNISHALVRVKKAVDALQASVDSALLNEILVGIKDNLHDVESYNKLINGVAAKANDLTNLFVEGSEDPKLCRLYAIKEEIAEVIKSIEEHRREVRLTLKQPSLKYVTVSQTEFLIEVKNSELKKAPSDWTQISSTKAVSRFHSPYIVEMYRKLLQLREKLQAAVKDAWKEFLKEFAAEFVRHKRAVNQLATLDCLLALAKVATLGSFCKPTFNCEPHHLKIEGGRHLIIEALSHDQNQFVPNDTMLHATEGPRVMTISGPNMGGKSSYIRQVALIVILSQIGSYVPAQSVSMSIFDAIYTRMGASDEIFKGRSTFMVELEEASEIMSDATPKSLVILDELGRGTSTHDGVAIAHATLDFFIHKKSCLTLFVTHFPTLSEFHNLYPDVVRNFHMAFLLEDENNDSSDVLTFLYQLTEGAAKKSYGLNVARLAGIPNDILGKAKEMAQNLEDKINLRDAFKKICKTDSENIAEVCKKAHFQC